MLVKSPRLSLRCKTKRKRDRSDHGGRRLGTEGDAGSAEIDGAGKVVRRKALTAKCSGGLGFPLMGNTHNQKGASMYKVFAATAVVALLSTPLLAQSVPEKTGVNSTLGISPSTQDFVTEAANSDMLEIELSKLVAAKGDAKDKAFA